MVTQERYRSHQLSQRDINLQGNEYDKSIVLTPIGEEEAEEEVQCQLDPTIPTPQQETLERALKLKQRSTAKMNTITSLPVKSPKSMS